LHFFSYRKIYIVLRRGLLSSVTEALFCTRHSSGSKHDAAPKSSLS